jgi:Fuc2NAc and GlcNAc transferase
MNALWLLPLAVAVGKGLVSGVVGLVIAYTPLILIACKFKAGVREKESV